MMVRKFPHFGNSTFTFTYSGQGISTCFSPQDAAPFCASGAAWGRGRGEPVSYVPFLTNFKKLGRLPLHGARTVRGAPDVLDLVAAEAPNQMPGRGAGGWMR